MSLQLDFTEVFDWASQPVTAWERDISVDERGVSEGREIAGSRRTVQAMITTESDFRGQFQALGEHIEGTVDVHIYPPDQFFAKERDGKQTYFSFGAYTFKISDLVPVNATHLSYRAVRFNDPGNNRY